MRHLILVLLMIGCTPNKDVDPELAPYFDKFQSEAIKRGVSIYMGVPMKFADLNGQDGHCDHAQGIIVDRSFWKFAGPVSREVLVFHEMGHCLLGRFEHMDTLLENGHAASIMNSKYRPDYGYRDNPEYYLDELFGTLE